MITVTHQTLKRIIILYILKTNIFALSSFSLHRSIFDNIPYGSHTGLKQTISFCHLQIFWNYRHMCWPYWTFDVIMNFVKLCLIFSWLPYLPNSYHKSIHISTIYLPSNYGLSFYMYIECAMFYNIKEILCDIIEKRDTGYSEIYWYFFYLQSINSKRSLLLDYKYEIYICSL